LNISREDKIGTDKKSRDKKIRKTRKSARIRVEFVRFFVYNKKFK